MRSNAEIAGIAFLALGTPLALLSASALFDYFLDKASYHFGTEIGGYFYSSPYHYIGLNALTLGLFALAVVVKSWAIRMTAVILQLVLLIATVSNW